MGLRTCALARECSSTAAIGCCFLVVLARSNARQKIRRVLDLAARYLAAAQSSCRRRAAFALVGGNVRGQPQKIAHVCIVVRRFTSTIPRL